MNEQQQFEQWLAEYLDFDREALERRRYVDEDGEVMYDGLTNEGMTEAADALASIALQAWQAARAQGGQEVDLCRCIGAGNGCCCDRCDPPPAKPESVPEWMGEISGNLKTQNNRITQDPLFVVFQKREIVTNEEFDYDRISWGSCDGEASEEIQDQLNELYDDPDSNFFREDQITHATDEGNETWQRAALKEIDEFVTACFTEAGAKAYLESNQHNLSRPFIYVTSLFRNEEMKRLREWLLSTAIAPTTTETGGGSDE